MGVKKDMNTYSNSTMYHMLKVFNEMVLAMPRAKAWMITHVHQIGYINHRERRT